MGSFRFYIFTFIWLFFSSHSFAQIPDAYYSSVNEVSGDALKTALHYIVKDHVEFPYTSSNTDTWDILKESDRDTTNTENVILLYSGWSVNAAQEYARGSGWNREHVWAKSHGDFGTTMGAGTDCHHLRPCDISVNSARGNDDFDIGGKIYVDGDGETQSKTDSDSWEPRDEVKGDVARMIFYMAIRYEGENGEPDLEILDEVNTADVEVANKGYHGKLSTLIEWHKADPVDNFEIRRNDVIYSYQKNRNPFIDHPEYVESVWDIGTATTIIKKPIFKVYPNPATDYIWVEVDGFAHGIIYSLNGMKINEFKTKGRMSVQNLNAGTYILQIATNNNVFNSQLIIQ